MKKEVIAEALSEVQDQFIEEAAIEPDAARIEKNSFSPDGEDGPGKDEKKDRKKQKKPIVIPFPSGRWVKAGIGVCAAIVLCLTAAAIHEPLKRRSAAKTDYAVSEDMDTGTGGYSGAYSMKAENSAAFEDSYAADMDGEVPMMEEAAEALYDSAPSAAQSSADDVSYREDGAGSPGTEGQTESDTEQKLVYSANLSLQTLSYEETAKGIRDLVKKYKGIIESESESDSNWNWYRSSDSDPKMTLYLTIRIPTEHYEDFLAGLEGSGRVVSRNVWVDNITRSYYDQKAVLKGLELQEERLLSMMEKAETIEDMIAVEARLTEVQTQLNQARTKLSGMDFDVAYSTVNLSLEEVTRYVPQETSSSFLDRLKETCIDAGYTFLGALQSLLFAFIYLLPYAAALLILFLIVRFLYRRAKARRQKKNQ